MLNLFRANKSSSFSLPLYSFTLTSLYKAVYIFTLAILQTELKAKAVKFDLAKIGQGQPRVTIRTI